MSGLQLPVQRQGRGGEADDGALGQPERVHGTPREHEREGGHEDERAADDAETPSDPAALHANQQQS